MKKMTLKNNSLSKVYERLLKKNKITKEDIPDSIKSKLKQKEE